MYHTDDKYHLDDGVFYTDDMLYRWCMYLQTKFVVSHLTIL